MSKIVDGTPLGLGSGSPADSEQLARQQAVARQEAIRQIERKRRFQVSAVVSAIGLTILVIIWAMVEYHNAGGWPTNGFSQSSGIHGVWNMWIIYPVIGVGLLLAVQGWSVYLRKPISETEIRHEIERQAGPPR
jgi:2TM domain